MIRATLEHKFFRRFLYVFLGCLAFSCWCLFDALIAYPRQLEIAMAYEQIDEDLRRDQWPEVAKEKGWPTAPPQKTAEAIGHGIGQQYFMIILCGLFGSWGLWKWLSVQGTWIEGNEEIIRHSNGTEVPIANITRIDKHQWAEKGIAKIRYTVNDRKKKFVMDDFKYDRAAMGKIMAMAEANLEDDQIVGGLRESQTRDVTQEDTDEDDEQESSAESSQQDSGEQEQH